MRIERGTSAVDQMVDAARAAWKKWTPEQSAAQGPLPGVPSYNPDRRIEEMRGQIRHWKSYIELVGTAASFAFLHVASQRLIGNEGIFLAAGVIVALPIIKEAAPSAIRGAIRFFRG